MNVARRALVVVTLAGVVAIALLATGAGALEPRAIPQESRLAVMPFKNLNDERALDWLKLGVAETMISDLRKQRSGVVERDQIDRALAEIALQGSKLSDESRAAAAGRIVGATHVVVGGFQRAQQQVRITARLVVVETGVVEATAKVTGDLEDIFGLQDALVAQLLKLPDPKRRPRPRKPKATIDAYQAYAASLATSSDAEKIEQLRRALDLDPGFHYALFDLRALESRLNRYASQGRALVDERSKAMLAIVEDANADVDERNLQATQLMTTLMSQYRYATLLEVATRISTMKLLPGKHVNAREYASYNAFLALNMLKRTDLALQHGERYLQTWPAGMFAQGLQLQLRSMIEQGHRHEEQVKRGARELEKLNFEERQYIADEQQRGREPAGLRVRQFAFNRCSIAVGSERWVEGLELCQAFAQHWQGSDDEDNLVKLARYLIAVRVFPELGRFDEANAEALRLLDEHPVWARENSLETLRNMLPRP